MWANQKIEKAFEKICDCDLQLIGAGDGAALLAKLLLEEPDMLLLDEPTNYLDIHSIKWLKNFLNDWRGELILVTHDRSFMNSVISHTLNIHRGEFRKTSGTTEKVLDKISMQIPEGQTVGITGETGSGKSTLMQILIGLWN